MSVPKLRFPEFKEEWKENKLGILSDVRDGTHDTPAYVDEGFPLITSKNLTSDGKLSFDNVSLISSSDFEEVNRRSKVDCGDVLFGMIGTIGNPVLIDRDDFAIKNVALIKERGQLKNEFLIWFLRGSNISRQFYNLNTGGTQKFIALGVIRGLIIPVPPLDEQKKIASFFKAVDGKLSALRRKRDLLKEYKRGLMQKLFSQTLRFTDANGQSFPDWEEKRLGDISNISTGDSNRQDSLDNGKYAFFDRSEDVRTSDRYLFDCEAIIVPGEGQDFIPKYFIGKFDLHQRTYAITKFDDHIGKFLYYSITHFRKHFLSHAVGSTVKSLRLPMFKKMKLFIPSIKEQQKIADALSSMDAKVSVVSDQIKKFEKFKKGLLQQMFV